METYNKLVATEIFRLENLGWQDWAQDDFSVRTPPSLKMIDISFPSDWYDPQSINEEAKGIWAETRARKILSLLNLNGINVLWEVGAGNGNVAIPLRDAGKVVIGIEPLRTGVESLIVNGIVAYQGTLEDLVFPDSSIDAIGIFDVLEHIEYPEVLLSEVRRVLKPGGALIVSVPANQYLFSDFDLSIGHFRRYSRKTLENLLTENGFKSNKFEYLFLAFVVPAFILRSIPYRFGRRRRYQNTINSNNKLSKIMELLRPLLEVLFRIEGKFRLPTGLSLISSSFKPD